MQYILDGLAMGANMYTMYKTHVKVEVNTK